MIAVKENQDVYFSSFERLEKRLAGKQPAWLGPIRQAAMNRFAELGFPTSKNEEWKFTSVAPIARLAFEPAEYEFNTSLAAKIKRAPLADLGCSRLVFMNGAFCPELSKLESLSAGVKAGSLATALASGSPLLEQHLARHAPYEQHAFVALNTAFMEDGAYIEIPKDTLLEKPVYLLYVTTSGAPNPRRAASNGERPRVTHPRNLVLIGRGSQVSFIEGYVGLEEGVYLTNAVTEVVAGEGAVINYHKVEAESERSFHLATLQFQEERSSSVTTYSFALGGALAREEMRMVLGGEGSECQLNGLYVTDGGQHVDNHTTIDHAKPHCGSRELYKGILDGKSSGVFNGKIIVRKDAQKTDSKQSNKNLLLSDGAVINTKPQLEIYADDVKCTHGATIGQIDQNAVFYLRSRGIGLEEARSLLTGAFANEITGRVKYEPLRARLATALGERLARGQKARET